MRNRFQAIIIGAGPAGLIAGRCLENALILDGKSQIGIPVQCGEAMSKNALKIQNIKPDRNWILTEIEYIQRIMPNGKIIGSKNKTKGFIIDRPKFEKYLASTLKSKIKLNSEVVKIHKEGILWKVETKNNQYYCDYIIGADGPNSICRRKIFHDKLDIIASIQYLIKVEREFKTGTLKIYLDNENINHGYVWIFPKTNNEANIGICGKGNLSNVFNKFLLNIVKEKYGEYSIIENRSGIIPIQKKDSRFYKDNIMLVGDAAGFADPFFKGGMSQAMHSAKIASDCIRTKRVRDYEQIIKALPFFDSNLIDASAAFYSLENNVLNELGDVLDERKTSYLKSLRGIHKCLLRKNLRKNIFKVYNFFSIWSKKHDYLW